MTTTDKNKLATINLNGTYINAKPGQTIIQAAMDHGVYIPYLCYHPGLDPYGACRMCVVETEVNGRKSIQASCTTPVTDGMIVIPCTMKTLSSIANGYDETLVARAAGVTIKEVRKLILVARETPLSAIHLENMLKLARLDVVIMPPVTEFYTNPTSIDAMVDHIVGKCLDQFDIEHDLFTRWGSK